MRSGGALKGGLKYTFVGYSFGAVLAWEVACAIAAKAPGEGPALLVAVSAEGPSWSGRAGKLHSSTDAEFKKVLTAKGGTDFILKDPGMSKMYLPVRRREHQHVSTRACVTRSLRLRIHARRSAPCRAQLITRNHVYSLA